MINFIVFHALANLQYYDVVNGVVEGEGVAKYDPEETTADQKGEHLFCMS
jgi:hypothetical protein